MNSLRSNKVSARLLGVMPFHSVDSSITETLEDILQQIKHTDDCTSAAEY